MHLNVRFSTGIGLKKFQDLLYEKPGQGISFTELSEPIGNKITIVTDVHNIKSNRGSRRRYKKGGDNINHRILPQKLWRTGIHDKRVLKLIRQMLTVGYIESDLFYATKAGTPQGGILSPLLSNGYLNDFDWYVGHTYMEPHRHCQHKGNDTQCLK